MVLLWECVLQGKGQVLGGEELAMEESRFASLTTRNMKRTRALLLMLGGGRWLPQPVPKQLLNHLSDC